MATLSVRQIEMSCEQSLEYSERKLINKKQFGCSQDTIYFNLFWKVVHKLFIQLIFGNYRTAHDYISKLITKQKKSKCQKNGDENN